MPLSPSRRTLAAVAVTAALFLSSPAVRALPIEEPGASRGIVQEVLREAAGWVRTFLSPLWQATGSGLDPSGKPSPPQTDGDAGSGLNPDGRP